MGLFPFAATDLADVSIRSGAHCAGTAVAGRCCGGARACRASIHFVSFPVFPSPVPASALARLSLVCRSRPRIHPRTAPAYRAAGPRGSAGGLLPTVERGPPATSV